MADVSKNVRTAVRAFVLIAAAASWVKPEWVAVLNNPEVELFAALALTEVWQWLESWFKTRKEKNLQNSTISLDNSEK